MAQSPTNYIGWKLFDKVTIVTKPMLKYDYEKGDTYDTGDVQGYIVDPKNLKQLKSAREWGTTYRYIYETDSNGNRTYKDREIIEPAEYTYDNKDFTLELYAAADGSCQGGKLSFWNCWITASDGKRFLIGIAADLLLDVLKSNTVINGVVQDKLMFARCKGGVGMLSKNMSSYQDAISDEQARKNNTKGKTSKHKVGHVYATLTQKNVYLGNFYRWYEPIYGEVKTDYYPYRESNQLVGFRKLDTPVTLKWFPTYYEGKDPAYYAEHFGTWQLETKLPARKELEDVSVEPPVLECCVDLIIDRHSEHYKAYCSARSQGLRMSRWADADSIGLSTNATEYEMPIEQRNLLIDMGYRVED